MTLDEVVAANVARLRRAKRWTIAKLASELGVGYYDVYGFEGRRPDRSQRPFRWSELVALCGALEVTLFELVLPPEGKQVETSATLGPPIVTASVEGDPGMTLWPPGRRELTWLLFHLDPKAVGAEPLAQLVDELRGETERRRREIAAVLAEAYEIARDMQEED